MSHFSFHSRITATRSRALLSAAFPTQPSNPVFARHFPAITSPRPNPTFLPSAPAIPRLRSPTVAARLLSPLARVREEEWMDRPSIPPAELADALAYIRKVNRRLGYNRATRARVAQWAATWKPNEPITLLDVATGSGDVPADLLQHFGQHNLHITGLDLHAVTLEEARRRVPAATFTRGDALNLPYADGSFDYVLSSMFVHHLDEPQVLTVLREMLRVARRGVLLADLLRNRRALTWIRLFTRLASPMIRHDAVVSVKQAFTPEEIQTLAAQAHWPTPNLQTHFGHRFTLVAEKRVASC